MKRILIILIVVLVSFGLGWWTNEMWQFGEGEIADEQRLDSLKKTKSSLIDSAETLKTNCSNKKTIRDYCSDDKYFFWSPNHPEPKGFMCEITLHDKTALYWYHGQCQYDYFTYLISDTTIEVLWSYRTDCILNMDFLEKSNGIKKYPKRGDTFATMTLTNDTTLKVKYNFPEWAKKVNAITKDSLFPTYYYLVQDN